MVTLRTRGLIPDTTLTGRTVASVTAEHAPEGDARQEPVREGTRGCSGLASASSNFSPRAPGPLSKGVASAGGCASEPRSGVVTAVMPKRWCTSRVSGLTHRAFTVRLGTTMSGLIRFIRRTSALEPLFLGRAYRHEGGAPVGTHVMVVAGSKDVLGLAGERRTAHN